jgi:hypothetical protein
MYRGQAESHTVGDPGVTNKVTGHQDDAAGAAKTHSDRLKPQTIYYYSVNSMQATARAME